MGGARYGMRWASRWEAMGVASGSWNAIWPDTAWRTIKCGNAFTCSESGHSGGPQAATVQHAKSIIPFMSV